MAAALFTILYNIALTIVLTLSVCCAVYLYHSYKRPALMALCVLFSVYLLDNTVVFCTELIPEFAGVYDEMFLETPSVKTVYFIVLVGCLLYALNCAIPAFTLRQAALLVFLYGAVLICIPMISRHEWMVFSYYFITQFLIIAISVYGLMMLRSAESSFDRGMVKRILRYFLCMSLLVLAEDSFVIFFLDRFYGPRMKINNRNFSENLLYIGLAWPVVRHTLSRLSRQAVQMQEPEPEPAPEPDRTQVDYYTFAAAYSLTEREQEILPHLLQAKSQQQISEELIIALGTVKTHIHNIYQKTGASNRSQLIAQYQAFCALRHSEAQLENTH